MKRALVTGITGQDGRFLAHFLTGKGYQVFGLIRGQNNPKRQIIEAQSRLSCRSRSRFSRAADFWCGERFSCVLGHLGAY